MQGPNAKPGCWGCVMARLSIAVMMLSLLSATYAYDDEGLSANLSTRMMQCEAPREAF